MKVMWIMSVFDWEKADANGISNSLKIALKTAYGSEIDLTFVFEARDAHSDMVRANDIVYYPLKAPLSKIGMSDAEWEKTCCELLRVIDELTPDIIQCFGCEWPYGAIAEYTNIPVVIHMMGFLNAYHIASQMATRSPIKPLRSCAGRFKRLLKHRAVVNPEQQSDSFELKTLRVNRYFMGRTEWDKQIVRHCSPGSKYYYVPEVLRQVFYDAAGSWRFRKSRKLKLLTVSSASSLKGNEIVLRTASILNNILKLDFEWRVAGDAKLYPAFERQAKIKCSSANVKLLGILEPEQIVSELEHTDLFVHPSIIDNSPNSICEAQLVGCPVIASNVGGVPQLVEDGLTGFLYPYNEPYTLAFLIADLFQNEALLTRVSGNAVSTARKRHDPEEIANLVMKAYKDIIDNEIRITR